MRNDRSTVALALATAATLVYPVAVLAQAGVPLAVPENARSSDRVLITASLESGSYRQRPGWGLPVAGRVALDRNALSLALAGAVLNSFSSTAADGFGVGATLGHRLWRQGERYTSASGRALVGITYSRFSPPGQPSVSQVDLPIALGLGLRLPPPGFAILPWVAPRLQPRVLRAGSGSTVRWLTGGSLGLEVVKTLCAPGTTCTVGWGLRLALEMIGDVGGGPLEGGVSLGAIWKFF